MRDVYLVHHGIKGQKWGIRRFQNKDGSLTSAGRSRYESKNGDSREGSSESNAGKRKSLSDRQKKALKTGAVFAAAALATYGTYRLAKSGKLDKYTKSGTDYVNKLLGKPQAVNVVKKLSKPESLAETLKNTNPNRGNAKYDNNCTLCSIASFMRQQGYDVKSGSTGGKMQQLGEQVEQCFKGAKVFEGSAVKFGRSRQDAAEMLVRRFGNDASGVCSIQWKNGGGHAFNWSIKNGVVKFFDGQVGQEDPVVSKYWKRINPNGGLTIARLDNAEINYEKIKELLE